ncbi:MAG: DUF402 domain-containing protein [Geodermatophilaceae bacterium]|nr:DUF402 domain-containing protein [Geodermatophilaceae bacterium]MDQ3454193.1 DUF402 domain-containing protein [Actinomycetota bacterium]
MKEIRVRSTKWDGALHKDFTALELGTDRHGRWLWLPEGSPVRTPVVTFPAGAGLRLVPEHTWWTAWFIPGRVECGRQGQLYVDVCTPAECTGDLIEFVDLDLDVERLGEGQVCVLDEDEFEANRHRYDYPAELVDRALRTCGEVLAAVRGAEPPFGGEHLRWLAVATRS